MRHAQESAGARLRFAAAFLLTGTLLSGCSSMFAALPTELGGMPADAPPRPEGPAPAFPAVHDMPPPRASTVMTPEQVKEAEEELMKARERQARQSAQSPKP